MNNTQKNLLKSKNHPLEVVTLSDERQQRLNALLENSWVNWNPRDHGFISEHQKIPSLGKEYLNLLNIRIGKANDELLIINDFEMKEAGKWIVAVRANCVSQDKGEKGDEIVDGILKELFRDYSIIHIRQVFREWILEEKYVPTVSEIKRNLDKKKNAAWHQRHKLYMLAEKIK